MDDGPGFGLILRIWRGFGAALHVYVQNEKEVIEYLLGCLCVGEI